MGHNFDTPKGKFTDWLMLFLLIPMSLFFAFQLTFYPNMPNATITALTVGGVLIALSRVLSVRSLNLAAFLRVAGSWIIILSGFIFLVLITRSFFFVPS